MSSVGKYFQAPQRISRNFSADETRLHPNAFINSRYNYAPLMWMFSGKTKSVKFIKETYKQFTMILINHMMNDSGRVFYGIICLELQNQGNTYCTCLVCC